MDDERYKQDNISQKAINSVNKGWRAFCKFLSDNDVGKTKSHQSGFYISKEAWTLMFDKPRPLGENLKHDVKIKWQDDVKTNSNFTYYGVGTRNECRLTAFGRGFDFHKPELVGSLLILVRREEGGDDYDAWVLTLEDDIDAFLNFFGMSPSDTGKLIRFDSFNEQDTEAVKTKKLFKEMDKFIYSLEGQFPSGRIMSSTARELYNKIYNHLENIIKNPDYELLKWNETEYSLFRRIEEIQFGDKIHEGFPNMESFIDTANSILNRRKSRAGKSLEYHLEELFNRNSLAFETQVITEEHKKPDFVFPSGAAYHNQLYSSNKLIVLGAKTTCKDRWRQVVTEADRVDTKYLCTLQQGISCQQLHEMQSEHVVLVVPRPYIKAYPQEYRDTILDLKTFIQFVHERLNNK